MEILPDEVIIGIFKYLSLKTILKCENVCQRWRKLTQDPVLWKRIVITYSGRPDQSDESEKIFHIIRSHRQYVYCLKLQYVDSYPFVMSILEKCSNLICLELVMCRINKEFETDITRWPNLKKINLKNSLLFQNSDLSIKYDIFSNLTYLALSDFGLSSINCDTLLRCKYLSHILIEKIKVLDLEFVTELILSKQNILETFHIYGGNAINNKCLCLLSECIKLKDLAIIRCENLTDEGLIVLAKLQQLIHLQIWNNTNFTEKALLSTLGCSTLAKLQSLSLSRIGNISPAVVDVISTSYKDLKFLAVYQCPRIVGTNYETKQLQSKFRNIDVVLY